MGPKVFLSHIGELLSWTGKSGFEALIRGKRPAVDAFVWLHELVYSYPEENYKGDYEPMVADFMSRVRKLLRYGAVPMVVFDGVHLKGKKANQSRASVRAAALQQLDDTFVAALAAGEEEEEIVASFDTKLLRAANEIKGDFVHAVIAELRENGVRYVVAPYEADAQIQQLYNEGMVDSCMTSDADLIIYGMPLVFLCKSSLWHDGNCRYYDDAKLARIAAPKDPLVRLAKEHGVAVYRFWAALVGCDYDSCDGIGPKRALQALQVAVNGLKSTRKGVAELTGEAVVAAALGKPPPGKKKKKTAAWEGKKAQWQEAMKTTLDCYQHQVVFNTGTKVQAPLDFPPGGVPAYCGKVTGGATDVPCPGDDTATTTTGAAEAAALGHFVTGALRPLPPVAGYLRDGDTEPTQLTDDLVLETPPLPLLLDIYGTPSEKAERPTSTDTNLRLLSAFKLAMEATTGNLQKPQMKVMQAFLASRNSTGFSSWNWRTLANGMVALLEVEQRAIKGAEDKGELPPPRFTIRDRSGRCLWDIKRGAVPTGDANATADTDSIKVEGEDKWVTDVALLSTLVPHFDPGFIEKNFQHLGATENPNVRALAKGYAHVATKSRVSFAGYHPLPDKKRPDVCALRIVVPASCKNQSYRNTLLMRWFVDSEGKMRFTEIVGRECRPALPSDCKDNSKWCKNALSGECTHCAANLFAWAGLPRSGRVESGSITESLQMWHVPCSGRAYDPLTDVALLPVVKPDRLRPTAGRRVVVCMMESPGRRGHSALPKGKSEELKGGGRDGGQRAAARARLLGALRGGWARRGEAAAMDIS